MGNSASSLPYSIGKQVFSLDGDGWTLHEGQQKSDGSAVSVFVAKKPGLVKLDLLKPALHHFTHCKKLRHPHILTVHATMDTDDPASAGDEKAVANNNASNAPTATTGDLIIVTEPCITLDAWLQTNPPPEELAWGLEGIVRGLHFLHASANLSHCNVCPSSFFVTKAGDVKLWNFSLVTPIAGGMNHIFLDYGRNVTPKQYQSPERLELRWDAIQALNTAHNMDSFSLGVLIAHLYGGHIPPPLQKAVQRLQTTNIKMRPRLQPLLKCPLFDTPYQKIQLQLLEFAVEPVETKIEFWKNLMPSLQAQLIPSQMAVHKILPLMKQSVQTICQSDSIRTQDLYRKEVLMTLPPMFYIGEHLLEGEQFAKELNPLISLLFSINDRGIRGTMLKNASLLVQRLDNNSLNLSVFEPMCSGFSDSSGALRELTLKATLSLVPHLTQPNLEKLSRYLVRLQNDEEAAIRTNTVIFFAKLAPHLTEMTRQKMLLPAFTRAMNDPFTPCRLAALQSTLQVKKFFEPKGIASKVLPAVTPCCVDADAGVRKEAFSAVEDLLYVLRQESERLASLPSDCTNSGGVPSTSTPTAKTIQQKQAVTVAPTVAVPAPAPAPASTSYFSSWMSSSTATKTVPAPTPLPPPPMPTPQVPPTPAPALIDDGKDGWDDDDDDDGWGDDDDNDITDGNTTSPAPAPARKPVITTATPPLATHAANPVSGDDFFATSFNNEAPAKPVVMAATRKPAGQGKLKIPTSNNNNNTNKTKPPKLAVQKLSSDNDDMEDGWDDF